MILPQSWRPLTPSPPGRPSWCCHCKGWWSTHTWSEWTLFHDDLLTGRKGCKQGSWGYWQSQSNCLFGLLKRLENEQWKKSVVLWTCFNLENWEDPSVAQIFTALFLTRLFDCCAWAFRDFASTLAPKKFNELRMKGEIRQLLTFWNFNLVINTVLAYNLPDKNLLSHCWEHTEHLGHSGRPHGR